MTAPNAPSHDALRARLAELASQQESILAEMDRIQAQLEGTGATGATTTDPEEIASHGDMRDDRIRLLEQQIVDFDSKYKRALADFQNYQRRALANEHEAKTQGAMQIVSALAPALDHFGLALNVDTSKVSAQQVRDGVAVIRDELMKILAGYGLSMIEPKPGDEFDPHRHEAMMRAAAEGVASGHVVQLFQPGYALGDRTLRPAKVSVAP